MRLARGSSHLSTLIWSPSRSRWVQLAQAHRADLDAWALARCTWALAVLRARRGVAELAAARGALTRDGPPAASQAFANFVPDGSVLFNGGAWRH